MRIFVVDLRIERVAIESPAPFQLTHNLRRDFRNMSSPTTAQRIGQFVFDARASHLAPRSRMVFERDILDSIGCTIGALPGNQVVSTRLQGARMMNQDSVRLVENFWKEVWQTPDNVDAVDNFVAHDFVLTTGGRDIVGRDAFKQWIRDFSAQIAHLEFEIVNTFQSADGRLVSARFCIRGLNNGLMGFPADQRRIEFTGNAIWHVDAEGRLVRNWVERSAFELFRDLKGVSDVDDPFAVARK